MIRTVSPERMREMEAVAISEGLSEQVLMERAALGALYHLNEMARGGEVLFLCGPGNNGGDGMALARLYALQGGSVFLARAGDISRQSAGAAAQERILSAMGVRANSLLEIKKYQPTVVVDALLGTGLSREPQGDVAEAIEWINGQNAPVLALDVPSGVNAADGHTLGVAVNAARTVAFGYRKPGHLLYPGRELCGETFVADIGLWHGCGQPDGPSALDEAAAAALAPKRPMQAHKGVFGHALAVAGSRRYAGAAALCVLGAIKSGAGLVTLASVPEAISAMRALSPEAMGIELDVTELKKMLPKIDAVCIGPGFGLGQFELATLCLAWNTDKPLVADADALTLISQRPDLFGPRSAETVLTPHPGEMARLTGLTIAEIAQNPIRAAEDLSRRMNAVVLLKGSTTVIAGPNDATALNVSGCVGMASGGSGDVLAGLICGLLAQGMLAFDAARLGAYVHGLAGEEAQKRNSSAGMTAIDTAKSIPLAWLRLEKHKISHSR